MISTAEKHLMDIERRGARTAIRADDLLSSQQYKKMIYDTAASIGRVTGDSAMLDKTASKMLPHHLPMSIASPMMDTKYR